MKEFFVEIVKFIRTIILLIFKEIKNPSK